MIETKCSDLIKRAILDVMTTNENILLMGLGVNDPKGIFGTTLGLEEHFPGRVIETPVSENAVTGIALGASVLGNPVILCHQRLDFALLSFDQIVNNGAKWKFMFGGNAGTVNITIRMIVGRGWGQGPTHSQALQAMLAQIPGLIVLAPSRGIDFYNAIMFSVQEEKPVVIIEHRWLHNIEADCSELESSKFLLAEVLQPGADLTIVAYSLNTFEALKAAAIIERAFDVTIEVVDLKSVSPIDWDLIHLSVKKTRRLLALDLSYEFLSISSQVVSYFAQNAFDELLVAPSVLGVPPYPEPTTKNLLSGYHVSTDRIVARVCEILELDGDVLLDGSISSEIDTPGTWFKGPF